MWQMELQTFVTCHAASSAELQLRFIFSQIRLCLAGSCICCISVARRSYPAFACLLSPGWRAGMRGMQASGLPVYSRGFLHCPPSSRFLWRIFHIFVLVVVLGTGHRLGTWEPPAAFLILCLVELSRNSFLQHISPLSNTPEIFLRR